MYSKFKLDLKKDVFSTYLKTFNSNERYSNIYLNGLKRYNNKKRAIESNIDQFITSNGHIDGSKMQGKWFPKIKADIFLSHSHKDQSFAIKLSEWLHMHFGLDVFIDSCIWGHSKKLLDIIADEYSLNTRSTIADAAGHVHMMLSTALSDMIDRTECVIFLNTPNSITPEDKTLSPWIYSEIAMTKLIRHKSTLKHRLTEQTKTFVRLSESQSKPVVVNYGVDISHLKDLNFNDLISLRRKCTFKNSSNALDELYKITGYEKWRLSQVK